MEITLRQVKADITKPTTNNMWDHFWQSGLGLVLVADMEGKWIASTFGCWIRVRCSNVTVWQAGEYMPRKEHVTS